MGRWETTDHGSVNALPAELDGEILRKRVNTKIVRVLLFFIK